MRIEKFEAVAYWEAYDNRDWGASWGFFTTEEEAREEVIKQDSKYTNGNIRKIVVKVPMIK